MTRTEQWNKVMPWGDSETNVTPPCQLARDFRYSQTIQSDNLGKARLNLS